MKLDSHVENSRNGEVTQSHESDPDDPIVKAAIRAYTEHEFESDDPIEQAAINFYREGQSREFDPDSFDRFSKKVSNEFDEKAKYYGGIYWCILITLGAITEWPGIGVMSLIAYYVICLMNCDFKRPFRRIFFASLFIVPCIGIRFLIKIIFGY